MFFKPSKNSGETAWPMWDLVDPEFMRLWPQKLLVQTSNVPQQVESRSNECAAFTESKKANKKDNFWELLYTVTLPNTWVNNYQHGWPKRVAFINSFQQRCYGLFCWRMVSVTLGEHNAKKIYCDQKILWSLLSCLSNMQQQQSSCRCMFRP